MNTLAKSKVHFEDNEIFVMCSLLLVNKVLFCFFGESAGWGEGGRVESK